MNDEIVAEISKHPPEWYRCRGFFINGYRVDGGKSGSRSRVYFLGDADKAGESTLALKCVKPSAEQDFGFNLAREIRALQGINHARVQRRVQFDELGGWMLSEYIGEELRDLLTRVGQLNYQESALIGLQILEAIEYLGEQGLMQADITPRNIGVRRNGKLEAGLMDFNTATSDTLGWYEADLIVGCPPYISPERIARIYGADNARFGLESEVFSLGVNIYEMLCGKLPWSLEGGMTEVFRRIVSNVPDNLGGIPDELNEVVMRMLAKRPEERARREEVAQVFRKFAGE